MSELVDLVGILGAIDDEVVARPELGPSVAALLCPYRDDAAGWFQPFRAFWATRTDDDDNRGWIPPLEEAVADLGESNEDEDFRPRDLARRLLTVAVLARVFPDYGPVGPEQARTRDVLGVSGLAGNSEDGRAQQLLELLADDEILPDLSQWDAVLDTAFDRELIEAVALQPPPCQSDIVAVHVGGSDLVAAAITTSFCDANLSYQRAEHVLDPSRWPECLKSFWCDMQPKPSPNPVITRYLETVALDCLHGPKLKTCLDFQSVPLNDRMYLGYQMSDNQPANGGDGIVIVDEGSIEVRRATAGACVRTTKRVLFDQHLLPLTPYQLAMLCCALGYADQGAQLVYNCAHEPPEHGRRKDRRPHEEPPDHPDECARYIDDVAAAARRCVTEWSTLSQECYRNAAAGRYTPDDFGRDVVSVSRRVAAEASRGLTLGLRGLRLAEGESVAPTRSANAPVPDDPARDEDPPDAAASAATPGKAARKNQKRKAKS